MNSTEISKLLAEIDSYDKNLKEMINANFSSKETKAFKLYYNNMYLRLIGYIIFKKDKYLSEKAKELKRLDEIFGKTYKWIGLTALIIVFPAIAIINLSFIEVNKSILMVGSAIYGILIFLSIRKMQQQPKGLVALLKNNGEICKDIVRLIEGMEKSGN